MKNKIIGIFVCSLVIVCSIVPTAGMLDLSLRYDAKNVRSSPLVPVVDDVILFEYSIQNAGDGFIRLVLDNSSTYDAQPGNPLIPKLVRHFELPFAATNVMVSLTVPGWHEQTLSGVVVPAQDHVSYGLSNDAAHVDVQRNNEVYTSSQLYPSTWFSYHVGCGLNETLCRVTHVTVEAYPLRYRPADDTLVVAESLVVEITYDQPASSVVSGCDAYDLVIVAPSVFSSELARLVEHKNNYDVATLFKSTEEIYEAYSGVDRPEQIKYFIKDAIETWNITYVLLVGGLQSLVYGSARDTTNHGTRDWYVPVRYSNLYDMYEDAVVEPGFLCDLYFSDIYKAGGVFDDWDSNDDGVFAARNKPDTLDDVLDLYPDVYVGRLPCRNIQEVASCVDKIIAYEQTAAGSEWFSRIVAVAGDGLHDSDYLNIEWDVTGVPGGEYTIYAKSRSNITGEWGPVNEVTVTVNPSRESVLHFSEDDEILDSYPGPAITEITSPSDGDVLGSTDVEFTPPRAYMGYLWANVTYVDDVMHIRGKSYDPRPYGFYTDVAVWIENEDGDIVFSEQKNKSRCYSDCEWATGDRLLGGGRAGAFYYMPDSFEKIYLWASNGQFTSQTDVINTLSEGCGFAFFFGHAGPHIMVVNMPGLPGGQGKSQVTGLRVINIGDPVFPMNSITNGNKLPIVLVMGCHNSLFNVTVCNTVFGWNKMWTFFSPTPECWSEWLTRVPQGGAIATIGCTALGPGGFDEDFVPDTGIWIFPEFFRQYGQEGHHILGVAFGQTITSYLSVLGLSNSIDQEMVQELALFGDPSLQIGGYP
jgi:hypothetical protein